MKAIILILTSFLTLTSCTKERLVLSDNFTINFENSGDGFDVVSFTDLQNGHVDTFNESSGVLQTARLNENHSYKVEWTQNVSNGSSCTVHLLGDINQSLYLHESIGTQNAVIDTTNFSPGWGFDIQCR